MRDENTRKTSSFSVTLEPISETSETDVVSPLTSVARENMSSPEFQESPQNGSQIGFHLSTGSSSSVVDKSSSGRDERASSGVWVHMLRVVTSQIWEVDYQLI